MLEKIKAVVDRLLLILLMQKTCPQNFATIKLLSIIQIKSSPFTSVFAFSTIWQIFKTTFYVFFIQTCRN